MVNPVSHKLILPPSEEFETSDLRYSEYERPKYTAALVPECENDVVNAVFYARSKDMPFIARSGHHSLSTTMRNFKGLVIDMRKIKHLSFNKAKYEVTAGGGVLTADFANFLHSHGMEVTVGSCPTTGLMGVAFGTGIGRLQGKYGYLSDNMVSCKIVLADGSVVTASRDSHPDLFWALRGAGHNFGIALEATFRVYPQCNGGVHYNWDLEYNLDQCGSVFHTLNEVYEKMPDELAIFVLWRRESLEGHKVQYPHLSGNHFLTQTQNLILINLVWSGELSDAGPYISNFEKLEPVLSSGMTRTTWDQLPWISYRGQNYNLSRPEVWKLAPYKIMGAVCVSKYDPDTVREFFESVKEMNKRYAGKGWFGAMFESFAHQKPRQSPDDDSAFPWRHGSEHFLMFTAVPVSLEDRAAFEEHLEKWKARFVKVSGYGQLHQYVNYGNTTSKWDPTESLYGYEPWRLAKLRELKQKYEPQGWFSWYQPFT